MKGREYDFGNLLPRPAMQICGDPLLLWLTLLLLLLLLAEALELLEHLLRRSRTLLRRRHNRGLLGRDLLGRRIVRR